MSHFERWQLEEGNVEISSEEPLAEHQFQFFYPSRMSLMGYTYIYEKLW